MATHVLGQRYSHYDEVVFPCSETFDNFSRETFDYNDRPSQLHRITKALK